MEYVPKELKEEVNVTPIHPLRYFARVTLILTGCGWLLYGLTGAIADQIATRLDPQLEALLGQSLSQPFPISEGDRDRQAVLQEILDELQVQQSSRLPKAQAVISDSDVVNALALPGGTILVTKGLLEQVESENELAFILAHELGHHELRHPIRGLGRSLLWLSALAVLGVGQNDPSFFNQTESLARQITDLQFSRVQEQNADYFALESVVHRYHHGGHALDFFNRLTEQDAQRASSVFKLEFFETHPFPLHRVQSLQRYAHQRQWSLSGNPTPLTWSNPDS